MKKNPKQAFRKGDTVMHWTYGLGKIVRLENRQLLGHKTTYYAVQIADMTVWVPADDQLDQRLRKPSSKAQLRKLRLLLSRSGVTLPIDRHERKTMLLEMLKDGRAESLCRVIRSLAAFSKTHPLNDNDQALLKRAQTALLAEWGHALNVTPQQAELQLKRLLGPVSSHGVR
jgi:RNA polymerase-interacting CarD/CdnL/TRCF family regulator